MLSKWIIATSTALAAASTVWATPAAVNPADYPSLSDKEVGHIRRIVKLSQNLSGDWTGFGSNMLQITERTTQFQLAFAAMGLGLAQYGITPAYHEIYQSGIENLIAKLTEPDVWERWMLSSRNGTFGGKSADITEGWMDPVMKDNIMLKGYLLQAGAMYEMLYNSRKYEQPGAFTFRYMGAGFGNGPITYRYTLTDIARNIRKEYIDSGYVGSACEPNVVYWVCNAISNVGFMHYDHVTGTHIAQELLPKFKEAWTKKGYMDPGSGQVVHAVVTTTGQPTSALSPQGGWGMWTNAWDPAFSKISYQKERETALQEYTSGEWAKGASGPGSGFASFRWGMYAYYAAEMGDKEATTKLLDYAERNFNPVWENGTYYYPRNDDYTPDAQGNSHGVDPWTGNVLIPMARLNRGGAFRKMYNEPWGSAEYAQPYISDVNQLTTNVNQAFFDAKKNALIVTVSPGPLQAADTTFVVRQLDAGKSYSVFRDGTNVGTVSKKGGSKAPNVTWREDGTVLVASELSGPHSIVLVAN